MTNPPFRRHGTIKIPRKPGLEIHVSELVLLPDSPQEVHTVEVREYNTEAEIYAHGIVIPVDLVEDVIQSMMIMYDLQGIRGA